MNIIKIVYKCIKSGVVIDCGSNATEFSDFVIYICIDYSKT
jgi:hypothetical protein